MIRRGPIGRGLVRRGLIRVRCVVCGAPCDPTSILNGVSAMLAWPLVIRPLLLSDQAAESEAPSWRHGGICLKGQWEASRLGRSAGSWLVQGSPGGESAARLGTGGWREVRHYSAQEAERGAALLDSAREVERGAAHLSTPRHRRSREVWLSEQLPAFHFLWPWLSERLPAFCLPPRKPAAGIGERESRRE